MSLLFGQVLLVFISESLLKSRVTKSKRLFAREQLRNTGVIRLRKARTVDIVLFSIHPKAQKISDKFSLKR